MSGLTLGGCSVLPLQTPAKSHIGVDHLPVVVDDIPAPITVNSSLPRPKAAAKVETYTISVRNVPVEDLLFALARDAKVNIDLHPGITGAVTINAIDQTLQQILTRMSKQIDMRWELDGPNLAVMPDTPFLRNYRVNYVNLSRDVSGTVTINTQIASTSAGASGGGGGGNSSATDVKITAKNHFWESLEKNLKDILRETDKILPEGSSETVMERSNQQSSSSPNAQTQPAATGTGANGPGNTQQQGTTVVKRTTFREAASVIVNAEAGIVVIRASSRQHEKVQEYMDNVIASTSRQVMIEATIAEVSLTDGYQQGINWQSLRTLGRGSGTEGVLTAIQNPSARTLSTTDSSGSTLATAVADSKSFLLNYLSPGAGISGTLKLLENFGNVKVLSSPKISVLNNQTAVLRVVDNYIYFKIAETQATTAVGQNPSAPTRTATPESVAVGLVMSVTPQISEGSQIVLNVRPNITRILSFIDDPVTPGNKVPQIQTREMESVLRLADGEIAIMGGLMSDELKNDTNAVPGLSRIPGLGNFFTSRNDTTTKTELVIFLKPTVIRDPSLSGDFRDFRNHLPRQDFFGNNPGPKPVQLRIGEGSAP